MVVDNPENTFANCEMVAFGGDSISLHFRRLLLEATGYEIPTQQRKVDGRSI